MLFRLKTEDKSYDELEEIIKKDLISTLKSKGVDITNIHIDLKTGSVSLSLKICSRQ